MDNNDLIEKLKILLIYGKRKVDGENKDGVEERIYKEEDDTVHFFYLKEFLQEHFKDEQELIEEKEKQEREHSHNVNGFIYILQKLGHLVLVENTSDPKHKRCIIFMPKQISENQRKALRKLQKQLEKENYNVVLLTDLHRDEDGIGATQKEGNSNVLIDFTEEMER